MVSGPILKNRPLMVITAAWRAGVQDLVVLVDTGFTGELKVSEETAQQLGLEISHTQRVQLGNGKHVDMACSLAVVSLEDVKNVVNVLISPGETVVGVGLLKKFQYVMTVNFPLNLLTLQRTPVASSP